MYHCVIVFPTDPDASLESGSALLQVPDSNPSLCTCHPDNVESKSTDHVISSSSLRALEIETMRHLLT